MNSNKPKNFTSVFGPGKKKDCLEQQKTSICEKPKLCCKKKGLKNG